MSAPAARPTLLTRMSRPPNASTVRSITSSIPSAVDTSACTREHLRGRGATRLHFPRRVASRSSPRAQMHTRQPSAASALALASPSPRLEPVTIGDLVGRVQGA